MALSASMSIVIVPMSPSRIEQSERVVVWFNSVFIQAELDVGRRCRLLGVSTARGSDKDCESGDAETAIRRAGLLHLRFLRGTGVGPRLVMNITIVTTDVNQTAARLSYLVHRVPSGVGES